MSHGSFGQCPSRLTYRTYRENTVLGGTESGTGWHSISIVCSRVKLAELDDVLLVYSQVLKITFGDLNAAVS